MHRGRQRLALAIATFAVLAAGVVIVLRRSTKRAPRAPDHAIVLPPIGAHDAAAPVDESLDRMDTLFAQPGLGPQQVHGVVVAGPGVTARTASITVGYAISPDLPLQERTVPVGSSFDFTTRAEEYELVAVGDDGSIATARVDARVSAAVSLTLEQCANEVSGTVVTADDAPIADAVIMLRGRDSWTTLSRDVSDELGRFALCWPSSVGSAYLGVSASGYARRSVWADRSELRIALVPQATLAGHVLVEKSREPLAGAIVIASAAEGYYEWTPTDGDGRFDLTQLSSGTVRLYVVAAGYLLPAPLDVDVLGGEAAEAECLVVPDAKIHGHLRDRRGAPVGGAKVTVSDVATSTSQGNAVTLSDGSFEVVGVQPGGVVFKVDGYDVLEPQTATAAAGILDVTVTVDERGVVEGTVEDTSGRAVSGARVVVEGPRTYQDVVSGQDGTFRVTGLPPTTFTVTAQTDTARSDEARVPLADGAHASVNLVLDDLLAVDGVVVDGAGRPFAHANVRLTPDEPVTRFWEAPMPKASVISSEDGHFSFRVASGRYRVEVDCGFSGNFSITDGPTVLSVDHPLAVKLAVRERRGRIAGLVIDTANRPVANARVSVGLGEGEDTTNSSGHFALEDVCPGQWTLNATTQRGAVAEVQVSPGDEQVTVVVEEAGAIAGELVGFAEPVVNVTFSLESPVQRSRAVSGSSFTFFSLKPGRYDLLARAGDSVAMGSVDVTAGQTAHLGLENIGVGDVTGRIVTRGDGEAALRCDARQPHVLFRKSGETFANLGDGRFALRGLPTGDTEISCRDPSEPPVFSSVSTHVAVARGQTIDVGDLSSTRLTHKSCRGVLILPGRDSVYHCTPPACGYLHVDDLIVEVDGESVRGMAGNGIESLICDQPTERRIRVDRGGVLVDVVLPPHF